MLNRGGHRGGLIFGPQLVSVKRAEIPAAGWIGPELRPCTAADMIWEETRQVPVGAGRGPRPGRRARLAGCRVPCLQPGRRAHEHAAEACALEFTGPAVARETGRTNRDRPGRGRSLGLTSVPLFSACRLVCGVVLSDAWLRGNRTSVRQRRWRNR